MDYTLHQRGRAAIDFLANLRSRSDRLEAVADEIAIAGGLNTEQLPDEPADLQAQVAPVLEAIPEFRVLKLCRDWTLEQHGSVAIAAGFSEAHWEGLGENRYPFVLIARKGESS